jgi:hypothetical protein
MTVGGTPFVGCGGTFKESDLVTWFSELHNMGVTSVRFWLFQEFTKSGADLTRFNYILSLSQQYNVKLIPVFENHWKECTQGRAKTSSWYQSGYRSPYGSYPLSLKDYIGKIVPNYTDNPNILMWQIMNEAEDSDTTSFYNFAKDVSGYIKSLDKNHLVSFGTMGSGQPGSSVYKKIHSLSTIDVLEYHDYNHESTALPSTLIDRINDSISLNKPLIIGEAGINLSSFTVAQRTNYFNNKIAAYFNKNGSAYFIWSYRDMNGSEAGYVFNYTDPLVGIIKNFTKNFSSISPTPTVTLVPIATPKPTITSVPTIVPTKTPSPTMYTHKLGGLDLNGYSNSLGYGKNVKIVNNVWVCSSNGTVINMTNACQWKYKATSFVAVEVYVGNPYSWVCYGQT